MFARLKSMTMVLWAICSLGIVSSLPPRCIAQSPPGQTGNRLTYLDDFLEPYYVHRDFPKLTTPQWVGEPGVEAVVVLAIDDMNDSQRYEDFLRPILDRLKQIDGRAPVSIMTNRIDPQDARLQQWLQEGLSIEVHTWDHPCPCLANSRFGAAVETYQHCVDVMASIPNNQPVAFRMPCCDSMNSPSPRFYAEIFNRPTPNGNFLTIDSSVFQVFTSADATLPRAAVLRDDGTERFQHYLPFPSFVNTIENYPFPYLIGPTCCQFPCMVPSDWEGQNVHAPNNPETIRDMEIALDLTVLKQGVFGLVFHPHQWMRQDQVIQLIDHAVSRYGNKVKFLTFREVHDRMNRALFAGQTLRAEDGGDNGVRLIDLNHDGYMDVVVANDQVQLTRVWQPETGQWLESPFPLPLVRRVVQPPSEHQSTSSAMATIHGRFGIISNRVVLFAHQDSGLASWEFDAQQWREAPQWLRGLPTSDRPTSDRPNDAGIHLAVQVGGRDHGLRFRDFDGDGNCELLLSNPAGNHVWQWREERWVVADYPFPNDIWVVDDHGRDAGLRFVDIDEDGIADVIFSNSDRYRLYLGRFDPGWKFLGWPRLVQAGDQVPGSAIPPIVRDPSEGVGGNQGVWFARRHLWLQNEDTSTLPDVVDRRSFDDLLGEVAAIPPPRMPQESHAAIQVRPGMEVELVACEPMVVDPIAMDWGPDGRLWVVEMSDYPLGTDGQGKPGGRIRVLTDSNGDGTYDQSAVFLDEIPFPTGVKVWRNGVLVTAAPEIFYAEDTDGDGRADMREVLFRGFVEGNQQHRVNGLRWGLDNWIHVANGDSGGTVESVRSGQRIGIGGRDLRIRPDTGEIVAESGMAQFGRVPDDWGNWFACNNTYPIWHYVLSDADLRRNPHFVPGEFRKHVSVTPGAAPVFPSSRTLPRFNDFHMADRFTSACGLMIYRDRFLGDEFAGNYFVCEPVHNLVQREVVSPAGVTFSSRRAADEQDREFLSSQDHWFRPTMARTGPDGAVWIADMYRLVIEHPEWIPADWQARLDLRAGETMGRLYRVFPAGRRPPIPRLDHLSPAELVQQLTHDNGWVRDMAQQMLIWNPDATTTEPLQRLATAGETPLGRLHALATLDGRGELSDVILEQAVQDSHAGVRRHAVRLAAPRLDGNPRLREAVVTQLAGESDLPVIMQGAIAIGETEDASFASRVAAVVAPHLGDSQMRMAMVSSLHGKNVAAIMDSLLEKWPHDQPEQNAHGWTEVIHAGMRFVTSTDDTPRLQLLIEGLLPVDSQPPSTGLTRRLHEHLQKVAASRIWQVTVLAHLLEGLSESQRAALPEKVAQRLPQIAGMIDEILSDENLEVELQATAVRLLAQDVLSRSESQERLRHLLQPQIALEVQRAAVRGLARFDQEEIADYLLENWASHAPGLRAEIMDVLFKRNEWIKRLLLAVEEKRIQVAQIDASRRQQLLQHRNQSIRRYAAAALAVAVNPDRQQLVQQYLAIREHEGDAERGRAVFRQHCSGCHRLDSVGHDVGPNLAAFVDKSDLGLLTAILDPNRAIEDRYLEYLALGIDGRQHRGMIGQETSNSITLVGQENKQVELVRREIEQIATSGLSWMPEGLEKDISIPAMADLIRYLRTSVPPHKEFPGNKPEYPFVRDDDSIRLLATNCRIYGPTLAFEQQYRNLGYWANAEDRAVWTIRVPKSGRYGVTLDYACADEVAGNRFLIQAAGQTIGGTVLGTGSWDEYQWKDVGFLELEEGEHEVVFRSEGPVNHFLLDLRSVVLWPQ